MTTVGSYNLLLSSRYRSSGSNQHPRWQIVPVITMQNEMNYLSLRVLSCEIPFSFKCINASNNAINWTFTVPQDSINTSGTIYLTPGNYSITQLLALLSSAIVQAQLNAGFALNKQCDYNFTYNAATGRATLGQTNIPNAHDVTFTLQWSTSDLAAEVFGFDLINTVLSFTAAGVDTSTNITSINSVLVTFPSLCMRSDELVLDPQYHRERYVENLMTPSNVIARYPILSTSNTWLMNGENSYACRLKTTVISEIDLYLTSVDYQSTFMEGLPWTIQIQIDEIEPPIVTMQRKLEVVDQLQLRQQIASLQQQRDSLLETVNRSVAKVRTRLKPVIEDQTKNGAEEQKAE